MRRTPVVLGTLSIIFGALVGAWSLLTPLAMGAFSKLAKSMPHMTELQAAQMEASQKMTEATQGSTVAFSAVFVVFSAVLIVIGLGLYRRRVWARFAAIKWAAAGLVWLVVNALLAFVWVMPKQRAIQEAVYAAHNVSPALAMSAGAQAATLLVSLLIYAVFPVVLLALLGRRSAEGDFISTPAPPTV